jgi:hypothetical protein
LRAPRKKPLVSQGNRASPPDMPIELLLLGLAVGGPVVWGLRTLWLMAR